MRFLSFWKFWWVAPVAGVVAVVMAGIPSLSQAQGWGVEVSYGHHTETGQIQAPCGCIFDNGSGNGAAIALTSDIVSFLGISVGLKAGVDFKRFNSAHLWPVLGAQAITPAGVQQLDTLFIQDNGQFSTTFVDLQPYARIKLFGTPVFVEIASGISLLAATHFYQYRQPVRGTTTQGQSVSDVKYASGATDTTLEDGPFRDISSWRYSAILSAGYEFNLFGFIIAPMVTYDQPISDLRTIDNYTSNWNVASLYGSVAFRFGF